jgi:hypothetical protein
MKRLACHSLILLLIISVLSQISIAGSEKPPHIKTQSIAIPEEPPQIHTQSIAIPEEPTAVNSGDNSTVDASIVPERQIVYSITQNDYVWKNGPASYPSGTSYTVLEGDPYGVGPYTIRIKFPPNYKLPAHNHDDLEELTVISGMIYLALGNELKEEAGFNLPAGGFTVLSPKMNHFIWTTKEGAIVQIHGIAPRVSMYVDEKNDPTWKKQLQPVIEVESAMTKNPFNPQMEGMKIGKKKSFKRSTEIVKSVTGKPLNSTTEKIKLMSKKSLKPGTEILKLGTKKSCNLATQEGRAVIKKPSKYRTEIVKSEEEKLLNSAMKVEKSAMKQSSKYATEIARSRTKPLNPLTTVEKSAMRKSTTLSTEAAKIAKSAAKKLLNPTIANIKKGTKKFFNPAHGTLMTVMKRTVNFVSESMGARTGKVFNSANGSVKTVTKKLLKPLSTVKNKPLNPPAEALSTIRKKASQPVSNPINTSNEKSLNFSEVKNSNTKPLNQTSGVANNKAKMMDLD